MTELLATPAASTSLAEMVRRAASQLATAETAAEVLEVRDAAAYAYDAIKRQSRLAKAKGAHDEIIAKAHRAQADALIIEAEAKRRLADEYDAAQERGEVAAGRPRTLPDGNTSATVGDIGLNSKQVHEARQIRDAEIADPGVVARTLEEKLDAGEEPTRAALREGVLAAAAIGLRGGGGGAHRPRHNPMYVPPTPAGQAWTHLYGTCRALAEWANAENLALAVAGRRERDDDQTRNTEVILHAAVILAEFGRTLDAH